MNSQLSARCPTCGYAVNGAIKVGAPLAAIREGAVALCIHCYQPGLFVITAFGATIRACTPKELAEIRANPTFVHIMDQLLEKVAGPELLAEAMRAQGRNVRTTVVATEPGHGGAPVRCRLCGRTAYLLGAPPEGAEPVLVCDECATAGIPDE